MKTKADNLASNAMDFLKGALKHAAQGATAVSAAWVATFDGRAVAYGAAGAVIAIVGLTFFLKSRS